MRLVWDRNTWQGHLWWQADNRQIHKRINVLLKDAIRNGNEGIGKPEPLKHDFAGYWSRYFTDERRLVYKIADAEVRIAAWRYDEGADATRASPLLWRMAAPQLAQGARGAQAGMGKTHSRVVVVSSPTGPTSSKFLAYRYGVTTFESLEDQRGVDVAQIRALLKLSPAERLAHMVEVVNTLQAIRDHAQAARS